MTNFIGLGDLASFMGTTIGSLTASLADLAVQAAQAKVRRYLDQEITLVTDDVVYLDGNGRFKLRLPERPVLSVSLIEEGWGDSLTWTALSTDSYHLRDSVLIRWDGAVWVPGQANVRVTYSHGWQVGAVDSDFSDSDFDVAHVPADLSLATLSLARRMYNNMAAEAAETEGFKGEDIGAYSYVDADAEAAAAGTALIPAEKYVLDAYRQAGWTAH